MKKPIAASEPKLAPFDVVVVPIAYADRHGEKKRPALVVSGPKVSADFGLAWLAMITSASNPRWDCDVEIVDLAAAGLPAPSRIRIVKIATIDATRILRRIGRLSTRDAKAAGARLREFFI